MTLKLAFTAVLLLCASSVRAEDLRPQVDPLVQPLLDDRLIVGAVIGVFREGKTEVYGYGEMAKGSGQTPNGNTVYEIGSMSKVFTGALLAQAVDEGNVKLDDPLQNYLPSDVKVPVIGKPITLEHLATHTSGLPRIPFNGILIFSSNPYASYTVDQLHTFISKWTFRGPPGSYGYSNLGMGLLGHVLAEREHKSYEQLLTDRITKSLEMHDTSIALNDDQRSRLATPYDGTLKQVENWDIPTLAGAGAIRSTVDDLLKFAAANLADDDKPLTKAFKLAHVQRHKIDGGLAIGLGWHIARDGETRWHNGMTGGYSSWLAIVPKRKVAVVLLSNTATIKTTTLGELITRVACGEKVEPPKHRQTIAVDVATLNSYAGVYALSPLFALTVTVEDGKLMVQATGQNKFEVFATSPTEFFYKVVDAQLTFVANEEGKIDRVILHQNGQNVEGKRKP